MLRQPLNLSIILFVISCVLIFFAFQSSHGINILQKVDLPSRGSNDLEARLNHSEVLYQKSLEGRNHMHREYKKDSNREKK